MKITKRRKISRDLHRLGLKGRLLTVVHEHLDYQSANTLKQQLILSLDPEEKDFIEYWIEPDPPQ